MAHKDPEKRRAYWKNWYEKNREDQIEKQKRYYREKIKTNPEALELKRQQTRDWYKRINKEDPVGQKQYRRRKHLRMQYGITEEHYSAMVEEQQFRCAICLKEAELVIDHNHKTGRVRGLLCQLCNNGIGRLGDNPTRLERAAVYLKNADKKILFVAKLQTAVENSSGNV